MKSKGRVTIPTDESFVEGTKEIAAKWGADAVRDCDGTELPKNVKELAEKVYNTYSCVRQNEGNRPSLVLQRRGCGSFLLNVLRSSSMFCRQMMPVFGGVTALTYA